VNADARSVVTLGNFDGVHRGHLALVERATSSAAERGLRAVAVTFDPHPAAVLRPESVPPSIQSVEERIDLLHANGVDEVVVLRFDEALAAQSPTEFVTDLLVHRLRADVVVVGENFRFGAGAAGDIAALSRLGAEHGFTVETVGLVEVDGRPASSTTLRALVAAGDLAAAARMLGRSFTITGEVVRGEGRGRTIGVPTANISVPAGRVLPADGVYACWARSGGSERLPAVVNIGLRPTFEGTGRTVEAHILIDPVAGPGDESRGWPADRREAGGPDLYGRPLTVSFVARIRGEERFDGPEALVHRIQKDIRLAQELLGAS
jgi:riboflavin kinase/FMN adenylyltransferase